MRLPHYLLFLRSVKAIEVYHMGEGDSEPKLLHSAESSRSDVQTKNPQTILRHFDKTTQGPGLSRDQFYSELMAIPDNKLPLMSSRQRVVVQTYSMDSKQPVVSHTDDMDYMIVSGLRGGKAKTMACDPATRHLKLIPLGSVAACLRWVQDMCCILIRHFL